MDEVKGAEAAYDSRLARNWRCGNWSVRGFSLDKFSLSEKQTIDGGSSSVVSVSVVAAPISASLYSDISLSQDRSLQTVAVGRTDGSVFVVSIGEEYLTDFVVDDNDKAGMTRRADISDFGVKGDEHIVDNNRQAPFEIIHQFIASEQGHPINKLVYHDSIKGNDYIGIVCTAAVTTGEITIWKLPINDTNDRGITQSIVLSGIHNDEIISLKTIILQSHQDDSDEHEVLFSASRDGKFALWNLRNGELLLSCQCTDDLMTTTCADVFNPSSWDNSHNNSGIYNDVIFFGTSSGYVCGYVIQELLTLPSKFRDNYRSEIINAVPSIRFRAHDAITAITCGGVGTIPSSSQVPTNPRMSSSILLTGGEDGTVKQWEILSQRQQSSSSSSTSVRMEHWPRMPSQRMKRRAHIFTPSHDGPVICISQQRDTSKFLTSGKDGSVCVWNASTGKVLFRMDGFSTVSSLACLGRELLVTDGMDNLVCVHDFGIADDAASNGYDLEEW